MTLSPPPKPDPTPDPALSFVGGRKVRWARAGDALFLKLSDVTSQGRVYKQALDQFFRKEFRDWRPRFGDFSVEIRLYALPGLPPLDLDNLAKAILDGLKGSLFFDDVQVARLLVERFEAAHEEILVIVRPRTEPAGDQRT